MMGIKFSADESWHEVTLGFHVFKHHTAHPWIGFTLQVIIGKRCYTADVILKGYRKYIWEMYERYETL